MNFTHLSDDGVTLDVDRDVFSENIERKWRPEQISKEWEVPVQPGGLESLESRNGCWRRMKGDDVEWQILTALFSYVHVEIYAYNTNFGRYLNEIST